jgi:hypothetical protein
MGPMRVDWSVEADTQTFQVSSVPLLEDRYSRIGLVTSNTVGICQLSHRVLVESVEMD